MKKYQTFGQLLIDFRIVNVLSQAEFAALTNVDTRTVQRWEKDITLVKTEKEDLIVNETLLPYQLIRNLNAAVPIPTFYDFLIRKYALTELANDMPDSTWFKAQIEDRTDRIRKIDLNTDIDYLLRVIEFHKLIPKNMQQMIRKAVEILPEMNLIITDDSGYYSGHSVVIPIRKEAYEKLKTKEMHENDLTLQDIVSDKTQEKPIFYGYDMSADCNDNLFYLFNQLMRFIRDYSNQNYLYCTTAYRMDNFELHREIGMKIIWETPEETTNLGLKFTRRFLEGSLQTFLND